jgi:GT2 family glycosyltransferase
MKISVIVVTYNGKAYIDKLFQSLSKAIALQPNTEIIVVDNASTDGTPILLEKYKKILGDKVKIIKLRKNLGFAGGNNAGLLFSSGDIAFLLNQDTYLDEKALITIYNLFSEHPNIGVAQCLLLQYRYPNLLDSCGDIISETGVGIIGCWGEKVNKADLKELKKIQLARGAALAVRKSILEISRKIHGAYIPTYFIAGGYEDWYISLFTRLLSYRVVLNPSCIVYHDSLTRRKHNPYIVYNALRLFIELNAPATMLLGRIFFSIIFDILISENKKNDTRMLLSALRSITRSIKESIRPRYYAEAVARFQRKRLSDLWKPKASAATWLRWYLTYLMYTTMVSA